MILRDLMLQAQTQVQSFETTELDLPETTISVLLLTGILVLVFGLTFRTSLRDTRFLKLPARVFLLTLRTIVLLLLLVILLNPRERSQTTRIQKSRVGILIDTSLSMAYPAKENEDETSGSAATRADAVREALITSGLLNELSKTHSLSVYQFDSALKGPVAVVSDQETSFITEKTEQPDDDTEESDDNVARVDLSSGETRTPEETNQQWDGILLPSGSETRLGESLHQLIGQLAGRTLSGVVVITDGRSNAGLDTEAARQRAERSDTRLIMVGVGSTKKQMNLRVAGMQSPTDVHRGDPFDISVVVQGSEMAEQSGTVRLYQQSAGSNGKDRKQVAEQPFTLPKENLPAEVKFQQQLNVPGKYEYVAVASPDDENISELTTDDNQRQRAVEVSDRKQKVLIISSGPMRDYRFVRNMLFRHSGIESDVWLQTVTEDNLGFVSQEAENVLTAFPKTEAELFEYDVIVAFDADWSLLTVRQQQYLNRWVAEHSGGIVFVAGELFTPELARAPEKNRDIHVMYPVVLNRMLSELRITQRADRPWPVTLTPEGRTTDFLKLADATGKSDVDLWKTFDGIYRSYPIRSVRDGAVVLAEYGNPRARTQIGQPPFLAAQFYGKGRTLFVSSAETWRLRSISAEGHQRFWTGMIRDVGQGRRSRGRSRGLLLTDRTEVSPGQTVTIRAQLFDARLQPLQRDSVSVSIVDSDGRPVSVPDRLRADGRRPGRYVGTFRPSRKGLFRITVPVPESSEILQTVVEVVLPNLESEDPSRNETLLTKLTEDTDGTYLDLDSLADVADLLPDRSEPVIVDEQLRTLWDRQWLMYLMIGLLALEWAARRFHRLS